MPSIRRQIVGPLDELGKEYAGLSGVYVETGDGRTYLRTNAQLKAEYDAEHAKTDSRKPVADRKAEALAATDAKLRQAKATALAGAVDVDGITFRFDEKTGEVLELTVSDEPATRREGKG